MEDREQLALNLPPFGELKRERFSWVGQTKIAFWAGCQARVDEYHKIPASDGTVVVDIDPLAVPPSQEQIKALEFLLQNEELVCTNLLKAVFEIYPKEREVFRKAYGYSNDMDEEEKEDFEEEYGYDVPVIEQPGELKDLIKLHTIHIQSTAKDGIAYLGYEFDCNWEEEHGLGVMMHGSRVIEIGPAEVAFNSVDKEDGQVDLELLYGEGVDMVDPNAEPEGYLVPNPETVGMLEELTRFRNLEEGKTRGN